MSVNQIAALIWAVAFVAAAVIAIAGGRRR